MTKLIVTITHYYVLFLRCGLQFQLLTINAINVNILAKKLFSFLYFSVAMSFLVLHTLVTLSLLWWCKLYGHIFLVWFCILILVLGLWQKGPLQTCLVSFRWFERIFLKVKIQWVVWSSHLIGHWLDLVQLPARVRGHPAQVAQEDRQLAQASLEAHLEEKSKWWNWKRKWERESYRLTTS